MLGIEADGDEPAVDLDDKDGKVYDAIVSKVLNNPKIDKRTLLQKFITRIEMDSNSEPLTGEVMQIKQLIDKESSADASER